MVELRALIPDVPDFPTAGIGFKDITPLLGSPAGFREAVAGLTAAAPRGVEAVLGLEARGFVFAAPVALALGVGFVPVRKPGKLPRATVETRYDLEYRSDSVAMHADALAPGAHVLLVDDVLATGGTLLAAAQLVAQAGAVVAGIAVVAELAFLGGRAKLAAEGHDVTALIRFDS